MKKKNKKEIIAKIVFLLIIILCSYVFINNIMKFINSNTKIQFTIDKKTEKEIEENISKLSENIEKIKKLNTNYFSAEELKTISSNLEDAKKIIEDKISLFDKNRRFKSTEVYEKICYPKQDYNSLSFLGKNIIGKLKKHNDNKYYALLDTNSINSFMLNAQRCENMREQIFNNGVISQIYFSGTNMLASDVRSELIYFVDLSDLVLSEVK